MILVLTIAIFITISVLVFVYYFSHRIFTMITFKSIITDDSKNYNDFKSEFYKHECERDINSKSLLTNINFYSTPQINYINDVLVIVDNVKYTFSLISYIRYRIFMLRYRTTIFNYKRNVNSLTDLRKQKLKRLK